MKTSNLASLLVVALVAVMPVVTVIIHHQHTGNDAQDSVYHFKLNDTADNYLELLSVNGFLNNTSSSIASVEVYEN